MQNPNDDPAPAPAGPEADSLAFDPVPRRNRVDGWTAERQRAFIETLAVTGSARRAAALIGKASFGAEQLRRAPGGESFSAAWDRAMAMAARTGRARRRLGLDPAAAAVEPRRQPHPRVPTGHAAGGGLGRSKARVP